MTLEEATDIALAIEASPRGQNRSDEVEDIRRMNRALDSWSVFVRRPRKNDVIEVAIPEDWPPTS